MASCPVQNFRCLRFYGVEGVSVHLAMGWKVFLLILALQYIYMIYIYMIYIYIHIQKAYVFADGHTESNAPDLFRPPKLRGSGPS